MSLRKIGEVLHSAAPDFVDFLWRSIRPLLFRTSLFLSAVSQFGVLAFICFGMAVLVDRYSILPLSWSIARTCMAAATINIQLRAAQTCGRHCDRVIDRSGWSGAGTPASSDALVGSGPGRGSAAFLCNENKNGEPAYKPGSSLELLSSIHTVFEQYFGTNAGSGPNTDDGPDDQSETTGLRGGDC